MHDTDVDLEAGTISIIQTLCHDGKEMQIGAESGNHMVAIDAKQSKLSRNWTSVAKRKSWKPALTFIMITA